MSREEFIGEISKYVEKNSKVFFPSITIAQAILESNAGKSELAVKANNLFGIKADDTWNEKVYIKDAVEEIDGKMVNVGKTEWRKYDNIQDSIKDHDTIMTRTDWHSNYYRHAINAKNYEEQAKALQGTYATDSQYAKKLMDIIERYKLYEFDNKTSNDDKSVIVETLRKLLKVTDADNIIKTLSELSKEILVNVEEADEEIEKEDSTKKEESKDEQLKEEEKPKGDKDNMAKKFKVGIDIGHGSNTFPANGKGVRRNGIGYAEHTFNSITSNKLRNLLENSNIEVVWLQQPYSPDIPLATRTNWYRNQNLDLIVSVHANANGNANVNGRCAFFWHTAPRARRLAELIIGEIRKQGYTTHGNGLHPSMLGSWTNLHMARVPANWANPVPSVLMEYGFMTGNLDFNLVFGSQQGKYSTDMAEATAKAICSFLGTAYRGGSSNAPSAPVTISSSSETHTVKAGDTLWAIAQANGISVEDLKSMNNLKTNVINVGQKLVVNVKEDKKDDVILTRPDTYTIQAGDTLGEVSTEFSVDISDLVKWNSISNPDVVNVGQVIKLKSNATVPAPKPSSSPRFVIGETVRIKQSARTYATNETIPASVKNRAYTIMQVTSDRVLLQEIMSWVRRSDIEGSTATSTPAPTPSTLKAGDRVVLSNSAQRYATNEVIPASIKGKTYTVHQVSGNRVLLREIMSWVNRGDLGGQSTPAPKATPIKVGDKVVINQSARTYATGNIAIPASVKGKVYTVQQTRSGQVLLKEIVSWVRTSDVTKR